MQNHAIRNHSGASRGRSRSEGNCRGAITTEHICPEFRGASGKKHQYSVAVYVDDMRLEKKNRSINEPIYFYAGGSRQAMELVVNQVGDKKISGYLSAPKVGAASATATAAKAN